MLVEDDEAGAIRSLEDTNNPFIHDVGDFGAIVRRFSLNQIDTCKRHNTLYSPLFGGLETRCRGGWLGPVIQFRHAAIAVGIGSLEGGTTLPALPESIQMLETLVQRGRVDRKLGEGNCRCHRNVREGPARRVRS